MRGISGVHLSENSLVIRVGEVFVNLPRQDIRDRLEELYHLNTFTNLVVQVTLIVISVNLFRRQYKSSGASSIILEYRGCFLRYPSTTFDRTFPGAIRKNASVKGAPSKTDEWKFSIQSFA